MAPSDETPMGIRDRTVYGLEAAPRAVPPFPRMCISRQTDEDVAKTFNLTAFMYTYSLDTVLYDIHVYTYASSREDEPRYGSP